MKGLMQDFPLIIPRILDYAERFHGSTEIVSRRLEGDIHRYTYSDLAERSRKLANALGRLGVSRGDVLGTIAWNGYRHLEIYYAVPGINALYHTINPRLLSEQLAYVISHAEDKLLFVEPMFVPVVENIANDVPGLRGVVILCDEKDMPETRLPNAKSYESLLAGESGDFEWPTIDESNAAGVCYTSGTTGNPKGVVYTHRSLVLQAMSTIIGMELTARDVIMPIVPMFHVNAWTIPFMAAILGNKLVLPGKDLDGASVFELLDNERVTFSAGVPTVWQMLFDFLDSSGNRLPHLKKAGVGGSAATRKMLETFRNEYNVEPMHAWGMTETSSMATLPTTTARIEMLGDDAIMAAKQTQGRGMFGTELKIVDENGNELPHDGKHAGHLCIRGWAVASAYLHAKESDEFLADGWFDTGDIAKIDVNGYVTLTDRAKDVIKSGGEWISSVELENIIAAHSDVAACAVIGVPHPKWDERPLMIVVLKDGRTFNKQELLSFMDSKVAKWCLPDDVVAVDSLPIGATGKVLKQPLREQYESHFQL